MSPPPPAAANSRARAVGQYSNVYHVITGRFCQRGHAGRTRRSGGGRLRDE